MRAAGGGAPIGETALDRVVAALSPEARVELLSYAAKVADPMPPDSSSWYVVGAVVQVNAAQRLSLVTLSEQAKTGSTILSGLSKVTAALPEIAKLSTAFAAVAVVAALTLATIGWRTGYGAGWDTLHTERWKSWNQGVCEGLANVRHDLRTRGADVQALDRERTQRGC